MAKTVFIFLVAFLSVTTLGLARASPEQWTEVTRFVGSADQDTAYFTCSHVEWRLNWSYTPNPEYPTLAGFSCSVKDNASQLVNLVTELGNDTTSGLTYLHNEAGTFYLSVSVANVVSYTIIIEEDLDSIPEFIPGLLFATLTIAAIIITANSRRARSRAL